MFYAILVIHLLLCVMLAGLVLLQQGKGADVGAAWGSGSSNTIFGAGGATSLIVKVTTGVAIAFMITSILLVRSYASFSESGGVFDEDSAAPQQTTESTAEPDAAPAESPAENAAPAPAPQGQGGAPAPAAPAAPVPANP